jgi:hypothetical protein
MQRTLVVGREASRLEHLASEHALESGVHRDVDDPHRQRELLALRAAERSMAVPALQQVGEEPRTAGDIPSPSASIPHAAARCGRCRAPFGEPGVPPEPRARALGCRGREESG